MAKTTKTRKQERPQDLITDLELMTIETRRSALALLRKQLREAEESLKGQEQDLIMRLDAGARVVGALHAEARTEVGQCRPEWKDAYLTHMENFHGQSRETTETALRGITTIPEKRVLLITTGRGS